VQPQVGSGEQPKQLYLAGVLEVARRRWWLLLAGAAAGVVLVMAASAAGRSGYEGSVKLLVGPMGARYSALKAASQQGETYADLATSAPVLDAARAHVRQPSAVVSANADYFTRVLTISAQARGRAASAAMASAVADALMRVTGPRRPGAPGELTVLGPAETSPAASGGRRKTLVAIAALAGVLASLTLLVSIDRRRPAIVTQPAEGAA
jgi:capsular polysaccharide biosynthesis protein